MNGMFVFCNTYAWAELHQQKCAQKLCGHLTTVFVDTRLWKTKRPRKRFQNFRQSCVLSTDRIEIHQLQPLV